MRRTCAICLAAAFLGGCGGASDPNAASATPDPFVGSSVCTSGVMSSINESEGPLMGPGRACVTCHADANAASGESDAPIFAFAGTVYTSGHEPTDCVASDSEGAEIEITDANGHVYTQTANAAGNFFDESPEFAFPYSAKIKYQGRERLMLEAQLIGDCNSCHSEKGDQLAPGRVVLP